MLQVSTAIPEGDVSNAKGGAKEQSEFVVVRSHMYEAWKYNSHKISSVTLFVLCFIIQPIRIVSKVNGTSCGSR